MNVQLNGELLRQLRTEQGIPANDLARILGIGTAVLTRIEHNDPTASAAITLRGIGNLATKLDIDPRQILNRPALQRQTPTTPKDHTADQLPDHDAQLLAGLLLKIKTQARIRELAMTLNWTVTRTQAAATTLTHKLHDTGLTITQRGDLLQLNATHAGDVETAHIRIQTTGIHTNGMGPVTARILHRVMRGRYRHPGRMSPNTRATLSMLTHLGAINMDNGAHPSAALQYALDV